MASDPHIDQLIILYLTHGANDQQQAELKQWINASPANQAVFDHISAIWLQRPPVFSDEGAERKRDDIWSAGTQTTQARQGSRGYLRTGFWMRAAATLLILLVSAWLTYEWTVDEPEAIGFVEMNSVAGERSTFILPDGTEVWLNAKSTLRYPENFSDTMRWVVLAGEAFFDVAHDKDRPFVVDAAGTSTEALGTTFNIQAFEGDDLVTVALLEGKVRVRDHSSAKVALLSPGEQLLISKDGERFSVQEFDHDKNLGWKDGILVFDGDDFETFCEVISRSYGVNITVIGAPAGDWSVRARYANERLWTVMRDIGFAKNFTFELKDKELIINFKVKPMI